MRNLQRVVSQLSASAWTMCPTRFLQLPTSRLVIRTTSFNPAIVRAFSSPFRGNGNSNDDIWGKAKGGGGVSNEGASDDLGWDIGSSWSTGLTEEHFDGEAVGHQTDTIDAQNYATDTSDAQNYATSSQSSSGSLETVDDIVKRFEKDFKRDRKFVDSVTDRWKEFSILMKQVREPGLRGSYLLDSEKEEIYRLHKENPEVYTVEKLATDFRIMRERVHAILYLKEEQKKMEEKLGHPLDDSIEKLLDVVHPLLKLRCREFHVSFLPHKPEFQVMPENWDGSARDPDEVLYEISKKEDDMMYEEFCKKFDYNKRMIAGQVKFHERSRMRPKEGFNYTFEKLGPKGKRGWHGGWKFVSMPDGSTRPLNELEKVFLVREKPRRRRKLSMAWPSYVKIKSSL